MFYRRNLPHLQRDSKAHFVTFCTYRRLALPEWARSTIFEVCMRANQWTVDLYALVVMPDHVHLTFVPKIDVHRSEVYSLARIMKAIKGTSSHQINKRLRVAGRVWQEESFDHVLRSSESLASKVDYVANNPVRRGW